MAAPSYVNAGTGVTDAGGAWSYSPALAAAIGNVIIVQILQDGATNNAVSVTGSSQINKLDGSAGWTQISGPNADGSFPVGGSAEARQFLFVGRATSVAAQANIQGANSTSEDLYIRSYEFSNVSTGTTLATVIENATAVGTQIAAQLSGGTDGSFGRIASNVESVAQSFVATTTPLNKIQIVIGKSGSPTDNVIVEVQADSSGSPSGTALASASLAGSGLSGVTTEPKDFYFNSLQLTNGATYWLVVRRSGSLSNSDYYKITYNSASDAYASGQQKTLTSGAWSSLNYDVSFSVNGGSASNGSGTSNTAADTAVTGIGPDRLALNFVAVNDDNAISAFTGETGGDWTLVTGGYADAGGTDGAIALQSSYFGFSTGEGWLSGTSFGRSPSFVEKMAQSFTATGDVYAVQVQLEKTGTPTDNVQIEIQTDSSGVPSGTRVGSAAQIAGGNIPASPNHVYFLGRVNATLTPSTRYWVVLSRTGSLDNSNYYDTSANSTTLAGENQATYVSGTWTADGTGQDIQLRLISSSTPTIDGGTGSIVDIDAWGVVGFALIGNTTLYEHQHFRFRNDDGSETTATWKAALDTATTYALNDKFRLRVALKDAMLGEPATFQPYMLYRVNGGAWTQIGNTASTDRHIRATLSGNVTDDEATTQQISSGTFTAGKVEENDSTTSSIDPGSGGVTEVEWSVEVYTTASPLVANDVVELAVAPNNNMTSLIPIQIPSFTVTSAGAPTEDQYPYVGAGYYPTQG